MRKETKLRYLAFALVALLFTAMPIQGLAQIIQSKPNTDVSSYDASRPYDLSPSKLYAEAAILIDADSGQVYFEKHADRKLMPASITKVMTALLALEHLSLDQMVTVESDCTAAQIGEANMGLEEGETLAVKDLLYGLLLKSANEAACALGKAISGSISGFVDLMNQKAQELGCENTHFANPHGLTEDDHYVCAADYAKVVKAAVSIDTFVDIISTQQYTIPATNIKDSRKLTNSNAMLPDSGREYAYDYCIGGKTGYTNAAQHTFVCVAEKDGVRLISVVLGSTKEGKWLDSTKLMDYGFSQLKKVSVGDALRALTDTTKTVTVSGVALGEQAQLQLRLSEDSLETALDLTLMTEAADEFQANFASYLTYDYDEAPAAPITMGDALGTVTLNYEGHDPQIFDLVAVRSVAADHVYPVAQVEDEGLGPPTLTTIAARAEASPFSKLTWLLFIPVVLFVALAIWLTIEIIRYSRNKRRRRAGLPPRRRRRSGARYMPSHGNRY